jgi:DNA-binding transcriptional LysR family regulator
MSVLLKSQVYTDFIWGVDTLSDLDMNRKWEDAVTLSGIPMPKAIWDWESRIGHRVKLRDLHVLSAVVRWKGMAKAAPHLAMSQAAVSEAIANLERALGVRLLDRSPKGVEPTAYADALLKRGHIIFDELRQGIKDIEFLADPTAGEVRIACAEMPAAGLLPAAIDQISRKYPRIIVRIMQLTPPRTTSGMEFHELREREVDLVLTAVYGELAEDLKVERLLDEPNYVVAAQSSPWASRRKIDLSDLIDEAWIFPTNPVIIKMIKDAFRTRGLRPPTECVSAASIPLRNYLLATGRFVTVLPKSVLHYNASRWSLKALPIDLRTKPPSVSILTLKHHTLSPVVQLFIEHLREAAKPIKVLARSGR